MTDQTKSELVQWQAMGPRGPGRWSYIHLTKDGRQTLCGKRIPSPHEVFRFEVASGGGDICLECQVKGEAKK